MARWDLSSEARRLLRHRLDGGRAEVDDATREAYRELVRAGLMEPISTFARGPESHYRLTRAAVEDGESAFRADPASTLHP